MQRGDGFLYNTQKEGTYEFVGQDTVKSFTSQELTPQPAVPLAWRELSVGDTNYMKNGLGKS